MPPMSHPPADANHANGTRWAPWRKDPLAPPTLGDGQLDPTDRARNERNAAARAEYRKRGQNQTGVGG